MGVFALQIYRRKLLDREVRIRSGRAEDREHLRKWLEFVTSPLFTVLSIGFLQAIPIPIIPEVTSAAVRLNLTFDRA